MLGGVPFEEDFVGFDVDFLDYGIPDVAFSTARSDSSEFSFFEEVLGQEGGPVFADVEFVEVAWHAVSC